MVGVSGGGLSIVLVVRKMLVFGYLSRYQPFTSQRKRDIARKQLAEGIEPGENRKAVK